MGLEDVTYKKTKMGTKSTLKIYIKTFTTCYSTYSYQIKI